MKKTKKTSSISTNIVVFIRSELFFKIILSLFAIQAIWLAISAVYPMLYDEYYHPAVIDIYSLQISPFINEQSAESVARYGDLTRAPSYLYHYLMSFPYRFIKLFTESFFVSIVFLRLINVIFVVVGLYLFRKLLLEAGFGKAVINVSLFILIMIPIFPHVASHVNYDNLLFLLTPTFLLYGLRILKDKTVNSKNIILFVSLGAIASIVKFSFLPIYFAASMFVAIHLYKKYDYKFIDKFYKNLMSGSKSTVFILVIFLLVSIGLFTERYLINIVKYKNISVTCEKIHKVEICNKQPLIERNKNAEIDKLNNSKQLYNVVDYTRSYWVTGIIDGAIVGGAKVGAEEKFDYQLKGSEGAAPIPILLATIWTVCFLSLIIVAYSWRELRNLNGFKYFNSVVLVYFLSVWLLTNYLGYLQTGQPYGVQPRYFILIMPIVIAYIVQSTNTAFSNKNLKIILFIVIALLFTQGGGITTYIIRSNEGWYWQRNYIIKANLKVKSFVKPFIKEN